MNNISQKSIGLVKKLFLNSDIEQAIILLTDELGNSLPFCEDYSKEDLERIQLAAIKISNGNIGQ